MHGLVRNHPLVDGNKRLAWLATRFFYAKNGYDLRAVDPAETNIFVRAVATGDYEVEELSKHLGDRVVQLPGR